MKKQWLSACVLAGTLGTLGMTAQATSNVDAKIAPNLLKALDQKAAQSFDVLVFMRDQADLSNAKALKAKEDKGRFVQNALAREAKSTQQGVINYAEKHGLSYQSYYVVNAVLVQGVTQAQIEALAGRSDVQRVTWDKVVQVIPEPQAGQTIGDSKKGDATGDNITSTGANKVWSEFGTKGEGIVVAGNDTGIEWEHPGLKSHYRGWNGGKVAHDYNWHDSVKASFNPNNKANECSYDTATPCDDNGHGTHTLGTMVGDDGGSNQVGMAPGAKWIGCRNMDAGAGKPSTYLECFQFFLAPWPHGGDPVTDAKPELAPHVINNSWGCPADEGCDGTEFLSTLKALKDAGIMVVAAAGNSGSACSTIEDSPAHHSDEVLVVGAHNHKTGEIASFSSRGPSKFDNKVGPDLTAPGENIRSTVKGGGYSGFLWSGTSMASPHVAGAVALLWSADKTLVGKIDDTVKVLTSAATPKTSSQTCGGTSGSTIPNNTFGYGTLDIYKAVRSRRAKP